jgi:hypothetical protein
VGREISDLKKRIKRVFSTRYRREISDAEAQEISENLVSLLETTLPYQMKKN